MGQRTIMHRTRPAPRAEVQCSENAFKLTFLALGFGLVAGVGIAGVIIPVVVHTVVPAVIRILAGA